MPIPYIYTYVHTLCADIDKRCVCTGYNYVQPLSCLLTLYTYRNLYILYAYIYTCVIYIYIYIHTPSATYGTIAYANLPLRQPIRNAVRFHANFPPISNFAFFQNSSSKKGKIRAFSGYVPCTVVPQEISKEIRGASNEMADFLSPR